jgi:hypothetical protein
VQVQVLSPALKQGKAAALLRARGVAWQDQAVQDAVRRAGPQAERGFEAYRAAWRDSQLARARPC